MVAAEGPGRKARARDRRAHRRGDRSGARYHQREFGQDGFCAGASVCRGWGQRHVVAGPTALPTPASVTREDVTSAAEMARAVDGHIANADIFIGVAAVADYAPVNPKTSKLKKANGALTLTLEPTIDILAACRGASEAAVLRRLRRRNRRPRGKRRGQAPTEEGPADHRQSRAGGDRRRRQRSHTARRCWIASAAAHGQARSGEEAGHRDRGAPGENMSTRVSVSRRI